MTNNDTTNKDMALPEKKGSVDHLVTQPEDIQKVIAGEKTATRRNGRLADEGEVFHLEGQEFVVHRVYSQALGELTNEHAQQEGYADVEAYKQSILAIHPGMPWLPQMRVWVHEYRAVQA